MVAFLVLIEGGGDTRAEQATLREGFAKLFAKALGDLPKPRIVLCGGRAQAYAAFEESYKTGYCLLLVDSEEAVRPGVSAWQHVHDRKGDRWERPPGARDDQLHFMVEAMEAWLIADPEALAAYYGQGFRESALPKQKERRKSLEEGAQQLSPARDEGRQDQG